MRKFSLTLVLCGAAMLSAAQDELLDLLDDNSDDVVTATFKSTRLINGHSVEIRSPKVLEFIISHRFGRLNGGSQQAYGLDNATIRLGLEYGLAKNLNVGIGRASFNKTFDTFLKYRAIRQSSQIPVTVTAFASVAYASDRNLRLPEKKHRYDYTTQLLIARKMNSKLSVQLMPTMIYRPLVPTNADDNTLIAIGMGGRYKASNRIAINFEYFPQLTEYNDERFDVVAFGVDIETGGHVFQLHLTNAEQMTEQGFIGETRDDISRRQLHFGFNISRVFNLGGKKHSGG